MYSQTGSSGAGNTRPVTAHHAVLVALLGEVALRRDGVLVPVPGTRARLLVAALATHPGRSRNAQALIDDVWGDEPPRAPMNALHTQVSRLRSALPEGVLEIGPAGYRLVLAPEQIDLTLAQRLEKQARQAHSAGDDAGCLEYVTAARELWRGEPGADLPPGPVADELAGLAATRARALDSLELAARETLGDLVGATELARRTAAADPFDEPAHATLMRLLATAGRTNEALDVFASLRTRLVDQLGADPGPALVAMNTAILRGEPLPGALPPADGQQGTGAPSGDAAGVGEPATGRAPAGSSGAGATGKLGAAVYGNGAATGWDSDYLAAHDDTGVPMVAIGLRVAPNPLLGREADLAALEGLLRQARVTTVLGPGGTGKTRVANELGVRLSVEKTVALVELASLRPDPGGVGETRIEIEAAIAATLGVGELNRDSNVLRPNRSRDIRVRLREALASRPMLLILDNCEHLVEAVAEVVADLVGVTSQLTVLTTSRAPLEISAETVYPLPPLLIDSAGSPATELFSARARAVRPSVRLDPEVVARLCHTLDGLPLAIELAAARVRTMSVEEIESRLDRRFTLLRSGDRGSPQRHRTLHAVIEWSWNLLDTEQRVAMRRLCRFPAGFTLAAAEAVCAGTEILDAATAVDGLVSQSLLSVIGEDQDGVESTRYRMLETVREFGEEQLAFAGEAELVMRRMSEWGIAFALEAARRYPTEDQILAVLATVAEIDNLVAVLRYALDRGDTRTVHTVYPLLAGLWVMRGAHVELLSWAPRIMALPLYIGVESNEEADLLMFGQLVLGLHMMFISGGTGGLRGVGTVRARIKQLLHSGLPFTPVFRYLGELATMDVRGGSWALARKLCTGARATDRASRVAALLLRANLRENSGDVYGSIRDAELALHAGISADTWGTAMVSQHLGSMYGQSARYADSVDYYRRAADLMNRLHAYEESVELRSYLAVSLAGVGKVEQARRELEPLMGMVGVARSLERSSLEPNHRRAVVTSGLAEVELAEGNIETGLLRYRRVLALLDWPSGGLSPGPGELMLASAVVDAYVVHGHADEVHKLVVQLADLAVVRLAQYWDLPQIGAVSCAIGTYLLAMGEFREQGLQMIALAPRVVARQDYPSMRLQRHLDLHRPVLGDERIAAALESTAHLGRRAAAERIMELVNEFHARQ
ncbi:AfsR/SARP family transcriptional regulator [Nocardia inohanensis]|uniref:AfsR/SARP family transcriptional regulator n=1 Tax=Nocardia inohanensis TaxID=209246 RepID=UPI000A04292F|nr:BTAD domain-containing putative transcriptional regulator [Nocardia inohanensis]